MAATGSRSLQSDGTALANRRRQAPIGLCCRGHGVWEASPPEQHCARVGHGGQGLPPYMVIAQYCGSGEGRVLSQMTKASKWRRWRRVGEAPGRT